MMLDLEKAKKELYASGDTVVIVKDGVVLAQRREKRVKPLLDIVMQLGDDLKGATLADRVIGKGAALLAIKAGIRAVYAVMISQPALEILKQFDILAAYEQMVPFIENQTRTDLCPVEQLVSTMDDPREAYEAIRKFVYKG